MVKVYNLEKPEQNNNPLSCIKGKKLTIFFAATTVIFVLCTVVLAILLASESDEDFHNDDDDFENNTTIKPIPVVQRRLQPWEAQLRIPREVRPLSYDVLLWPNMTRGTFGGSLLVTFELSAPRTWVPIHAKNLAVSFLNLTDSKNMSIAVQQTLYRDGNEFFLIMLGSEMPQGVYNLKLSFTGTLKGRLVGFYQSYPTANNTKPLATTKFEPVDARSAFPCFDEPGLKAKFTISLVRPTNGYNALSNMGIKSEEPGPGPGLTTVHFHTTVPMSTYLVCFIVSDFVSSGPSNVSNVGSSLPIQVFATPHQVDNTKLARSVAVDVTKFYIHYFGIPYSLPKLDLIAIPDFASGAMENWGLITFRETALLYDSTVNSASEKLRVIRVIAHEVAHQWFGNYVTMQWWDDLWLNEGFAKFMEFKASGKGVAECADWKLDDYFSYSIVQDVMDSDAAFNSHPIVQPVNHPDEINQLFDSISYLKGASVLRMLEDFLGEDKFQSGLQAYLKANAFSNAATKDLWRNLGAVAPSSVDVAEVMATWTEQKGFPVVEVNRTGDKLRLTQKRFLTNANATFDSKESRFGYMWDIPIRYSMPGIQKRPLVWLKRNDSELVLTVPSNVPYVKINYKQIGYYRVNYQPDDWRILSANIQNFEPADRAQLINDVFALAAAGYTDYSIAFDMISYLGTETEFLPWASARAAIFELANLLYSTPVYPSFRKFVANLVSPLYGNNSGQFNWTVHSNDSFLKRQLRVTILTLACKMGVRACMDDVSSAFRTWANDPLKPLHPDVRELLYIYGMKSAGTSEIWDKVWDLYKKETNAQKIATFQRTLAAISEPWILQKYLNYAWSEDNVRSQDYVMVLINIASNPIGRSIVWDFYRNNWPQLVDRFSLRHRVLGSSILAFTKSFTTPLKLEELDAFFKKYPDAGAGSSARKNARENVENNIEWVSRNNEKIKDWLQSNMQ